jgi:hypothetical protein
LHAVQYQQPGEQHDGVVVLSMSRNRFVLLTVLLGVLAVVGYAAVPDPVVVPPDACIALCPGEAAPAAPLAPGDNYRCTRSVGTIACGANVEGDVEWEELVGNAWGELVRHHGRGRLKPGVHDVRKLRRYRLIGYTPVNSNTH